ncbi:MAG: general stress protein CsbD [Bacteroidetes bacterium GWF2_42_66]|nr:MAG: general stress protein CsbD [Bacteroidetes bacterium GWA2_42_15]OFX97512.1 MAG: general stress protein CsbD [Bacteroidetes bacterium GWE2_42_39]OFY43794.1 MAG: general stress protein CsbD [Bacteroidetes bacterium GWF2_42_66]HBL76226.1 general stress protein CsbD [Prolixibacteraceae bacterium]HCR89280.1 general stress protein CsbD [Prolixibacteraceae bacterium]
MDTAGSKKNLNEEKGKLKQKFASLTDNDLLFEEGKKEEIFGKYEVRLDQTKEDLQKIISSL